MPKPPRLEPGEQTDRALKRTEQILGDYPRDDLASLVDGSPALKQSLVYAVSRDALVGMSPNFLTPEGTASYDPDSRRFEFPSALLDDANKATFVLGHEVGHAVDRAIHGNHLKDRFEAGVNALVSGRDSDPGPRDYTGLIRDAVLDLRRNEAEAHISGFNALASRLAHNNNGPVSLDAMYEAAPDYMRDFMVVKGESPNRTVSMKEGLTLGDDGSLSMELATEEGARNVEAMKVYYADKLAGSEGPIGALNYSHYMLQHALKHIHQIEENQHAPPEESSIAQNPRETYVVDFSNLGFTVNKALLNIPASGSIQSSKAFDEAYPYLICDDHMSTSVTSAQQQYTKDLLRQAADALTVDPTLLNAEQKKPAAFDLLCAQTAYEAIAKGVQPIAAVIRDKTGENLIVCDNDPENTATHRAMFRPDTGKDAMAMRYEQKIFDLAAAPAMQRYDHQMQYTQELMQNTAKALTADPGLLTSAQSLQRPFQMLCAQTAYVAATHGVLPIATVTRDPVSQELIIKGQAGPEGSSAKSVMFAPASWKEAMAADYQQKLFEFAAGPTQELHNQQQEQKKTKDPGNITL